MDEGIFLSGLLRSMAAVRVEEGLGVPLAPDDVTENHVAAQTRITGGFDGPLPRNICISAIIPEYRTHSSTWG